MQGEYLDLHLSQRYFMLCEMQTALSRIWTWVTMSIFYDDNHYTMRVIWNSFFVGSLLRHWDPNKCYLWEAGYFFKVGTLIFLLEVLCFLYRRYPAFLLRVPRFLRVICTGWRQCKENQYKINQLYHNCIARVKIQVSKNLSSSLVPFSGLFAETFLM